MAEEDSTDSMTYIVSLSGGVGSAMAAERALQRYGDRVKLWFSDVRHEDEDLYRFMQDTAKRWWQRYGVRLYIHRNERNPLMVAEQKVIIPNERRAPCSHELKIMPFRRYIAQLPRPLTIMLGMDWKEQHRLEAPRKAYEALGYQVEYPLMWKPWELRPYQDVIREEWGIEPPRLYAMGFPHNNCGGRCIKQGVKEWLRLRYHFPERFEAMKQWELAEPSKRWRSGNTCHLLGGAQQGEVSLDAGGDRTAQAPRGAMNSKCRRSLTAASTKMIAYIATAPMHKLVSGACNEWVNSSGGRADGGARCGRVPFAWRHTPLLASRLPGERCLSARSGRITPTVQRLHVSAESQLERSRHQAR